MCNENLEICIIDSGVNEAGLQIGRLSTNVEITGTLRIRKRYRYDPHTVSHATVCAAIIRKYAPDAPLHSIKILNGRHKSTIGQLKAALLWCLDNNIKIIHMSIGSVIYGDFAEIKRLTDTACRQGAVIVAACNNNGRLTYPAALDNVIGVKCDRSGRLQEGEYIYNGAGFDGVEITACGRHSLLTPGGKSFESVCANSYAAPLITALVYNIVKENPGTDLAGIRAALRRGAVEGPGSPYIGALSRYTGWIENALIADFGDNGKSLENIRVPFTIRGSIRGESSADGDTWAGKGRLLEQTDTVILLPPDCRSNPTEKGITDFLREAVRLNKNIVCLGENYMDVIAGDIGEQQNIRIWCPDIYDSFNYKGYLKKDIEVPVIMLYADSQHMQVELLQKLTDAFCRDGYYSIGISDSALGVLAGLEYLCAGYRERGCKELLQAFYNLHDPDIMLVGISGERGFAAAADEIKPDIKLVLADGNGVSCEDVASREVYIIPEDTPVSKCMESTAVFNYAKGEGIEEIYKCILSILDAYDEPVENNITAAIASGRG